MRVSRLEQTILGALDELEDHPHWSKATKARCITRAVEDEIRDQIGRAVFDFLFAEPEE